MKIVGCHSRLTFIWRVRKIQNNSTTLQDVYLDFVVNKERFIDEHFKPIETERKGKRKRKRKENKNDVLKIKKHH